MKSLIILLLIFGFSIAQAGLIYSSKDWSAHKAVSTVLGKDGCIAETVFTDEDQENWHLQIIKLKTTEGDYSAPVVMAFPENATTKEYFEGTAQSNKVGTTIFSMTLFQPDNQIITPIGSRLSDSGEMIRRIKGDSKFNVSFLSDETIIKEIPFSLRGSSKTIAKMISTCK